MFSNNLYLINNLLRHNKFWRVHFYRFREWCNYYCNVKLTRLIVKIRSLIMICPFWVKLLSCGAVIILWSQTNILRHFILIKDTLTHFHFLFLPFPHTNIIKIKTKHPINLEDLYCHVYSWREYTISKRHFCWWGHLRRP